MAGIKLSRLKFKSYSKPAKYYGDLLFSHRTKGATEKMLPLNNVSNQIGYNRIISNDYINYMIQVQSFGDSLIPDVLSHIRNKLKITHSGKIYVDLFKRTIPHRIKWNSSAMKVNVQSWKQMRTRKKKTEEKIEDEGYSSTFSNMSINWENRREGSWNYFKKCEEQGIQLGLTAYVFRIRIPKDEKVHVNILFEAIADAFAFHNINAKVINTYLYDAVSEMSPFKHEGTKLASKLIADRVLSTLITSRSSPLTQGALNRGNIILGNDNRNRQLAYLDTHPKNGKGTNGIIVSTTGGGKSVLSKSIGEQVLATNDYMYIIDYEGNEYTPFGDAYGATYLDLMGGDGKYYDPLKFGNLTGIKEIDGSILKLAINGTHMVISIMLEKPLNARQKKIIDMALKDYALSNNLDFKDKSTWHNAQNMSIKGLLPKLKNYNASEKYRAKYGKDLEELVDTLDLYFNGIESYMFQHPISLDELKNEKLLIIRFGGDTKADLVGSEPVDIMMNQLTVMLLLQELGRYRRTQNESFVIVMEELQRYLRHAGSVAWTNTMYTGIRKCNGSIIGIINDPEKLNENLSALINNSEYVIIGETKDIKALQYMFNTPLLNGCEEQVKELATLDHSFLFKAKGNVSSIFRVELPRQYLESDIYRTRTDKLA